MYKTSFVFTTCYVILTVINGEYPMVTQECPDPSLRNPYDPALAFNRYLGTNTYSLHPRNDYIVARVLQNINDHKVSFSRKVPIFVVQPDSDWETFSVEYNHASNWATFKVPPEELVQGEMGTSAYDSAEDFPFLIFDPNSTEHGLFTELRGFHTYIDYTAKVFYCEGCGLFKYNNDGEIMPPSTETSMGDDYIGQGTGCGLSWPGVVRRDDVLSGVIAHAIRAAWSSCDFFDTIWVSPATKTDQPKGVSQALIDSVADSARVAMGYRFRLAPETECDDRLAPMYENNGLWLPPTTMMTAFVRMFCTALRDYGFILSDGSGGCQSSIFQGESGVTANWTEVFDAELDDSTASWSFLIRDETTPDDNRYRDERYGVPWNMLQVLNDSDVGEINDCCNNEVCAPSAPPTTTPFVDTTAGPQCLNENCCFKHRIMNYRVRIADDNCVVYNCTFASVEAADIVVIRRKRDGSYSNNTLIAMNTFNVNPSASQDAIDLKGATNTFIYDNWFSDTIQTGYKPISLHLATYVEIENNTFTGPNDTIAIDLVGNSSLTDVQDVYITGNSFDDMDYGVHIYKVTNIYITNNVFTNFHSGGTAIRWKYSKTYEETANSVHIEGNTMQNVGRGIYVQHDIGTVTILNNNITDITGTKGIEFAGTSSGAVIDGNVISNIAEIGIYTAVGNDDMQIINNLLEHTGDHGMRLEGDNTLISANTIHGVDVTSSSGRALYVHSYATISRNTIYDASRRGISMSSTTAMAAGQLIIENNMIYGINAEPLHFYITSSDHSPTETIVRFNTIVTDTGSMAISLSSNINSFDIYCNLVVGLTDSDFWSTSSSIIRNEFGNLRYTYANISRIGFVNDDFTTLETVDLHIETTSPVIQKCDALDTGLYPLPAVDIDGVTRPASYIDVGADQRSPVQPTAPTTIDPTLTPSSTPTSAPSRVPSSSPTESPTITGATEPPSSTPISAPTLSPLPAGVTHPPSRTPTISPSIVPTNALVPSDDPTMSPVIQTTSDGGDDGNNKSREDDDHSHGGLYALVVIFALFCVVFAGLFGVYFMKHKQLKESLKDTGGVQMGRGQKRDMMKAKSQEIDDSDDDVAAGINQTKL